MLSLCRLSRTGDGIPTSLKPALFQMRPRLRFRVTILDGQRRLSLCPHSSLLTQVVSMALALQRVFVGSVASRLLPSIEPISHQRRVFASSNRLLLLTPCFLPDELALFPLPVRVSFRSELE